MCAPWVNLEVGKFGSPHKLCIIRTLEFVYFSFLGSFYEAPMPHKLCIIRTLEFVYFSFLGGHLSMLGLYG